MGKIKFKFNEKKIMRRGIMSLILDPIIFILILKYINQNSAYLYICFKFIFMFTAYGIGLFRQFLYFCKVNIKNISDIFEFDEDENYQINLSIIFLMFESCIFSYGILYAGYCYRPLLIGDDIYNLLICYELITILILLCSYRVEKKFRIDKELNDNPIEEISNIN